MATACVLAALRRGVQDVVMVLHRPWAGQCQLEEPPRMLDKNRSLIVKEKIYLFNYNQCG